MTRETRKQWDGWRRTGMWQVESRFAVAFFTLFLCFLVFFLAPHVIVFCINPPYTPQSCEKVGVFLVLFSLFGLFTFTFGTK